MRGLTIACLALAAVLAATAAAALSPEWVEGKWECTVADEGEWLTLEVNPDGSYLIEISDVDEVRYQLDKQNGRIGVIHDMESEQYEWIDYSVNAESLVLTNNGEELPFILLWKPKERKSPVVGRWLADVPEEMRGDDRFDPEKLILEFSDDGIAAARIFNERIAGDWSIGEDGVLTIEVEGEECEGVYSAKSEILLVSVDGSDYPFFRHD